jgi:hypothetical protein
MAVENVINGAGNVQKTIPGIATTFTDVPTSLNQLPCFVNYPSDGNISRSGNVRTTTHHIDMDLYVQKGGDLSAADRICKPFIAKVINTFDQNLTLGGSALKAAVVDYKYGGLNYAGNDYIGIKFTLEATEIEPVVFKG